MKFSRKKRIFLKFAKNYFCDIFSAIHLLSGLSSNETDGVPRCPRKRIKSSSTHHLVAVHSCVDDLHANHVAFLNDNVLIGSFVTRRTVVRIELHVLSYALKTKHRNSITEKSSNSKMKKKQLCFCTRGIRTFRHFTAAVLLVVPRMSKINNLTEQLIILVWSLHWLPVNECKAVTYMF